MAVTASAVWRVRKLGSNTNGAGYDPSLGGSTDYSTQDSAQASGLHGTATGTTTFTDAVASNFTAAMVGNALWISSGVGFTTGAYFVTAYTSATQVTLDRSPGTGTVANWNLGGAWADPFTNVQSSGPLVPGNIVYVRGAGTDAPTTADYNASGYVTPTSGSATTGLIKFIGENGRPMLTCNSGDLIYYNNVHVSFENIFFRALSASFNTYGLVNGSGSGVVPVINCTFDQNGFDAIGYAGTGPVIACEFYSSVANGAAAGTAYAIQSEDYGILIYGCNIHDCWGDGINIVADSMASVVNNIIAKCAGNGIDVNSTTPYYRSHIIGNTIDANGGHGINYASQAGLLAVDCVSNLITNHVGASKYGINVAAGTTAANNLVKAFIDFNWFFNNTTANFSALSASVHDNTAGTDPLYTSQSTENYTLQSASTAIGAGFPSAANPSLPIGASPVAHATMQPNFLKRSTTPVVESYVDNGAVQRIMATGGASMLVHPGMVGGARG